MFKPRRGAESGPSQESDLRGLQQGDELVDLLVGDAVHDLALVPDQLHDHLGHVDSDATLGTVQHTQR